MTTRRRRVLAAIGALALAGLVSGSVWQLVSARVERAASARPGHLVSVHGARLHVYCTGTGSPTVVFEAGLGETLADWQLVQPDISRRTTACSYDRAGLGGSSGAHGVRDATHLAQDLDALLHTSGMHGPFILVGHSLGGLVVRVLAGQHPTEVAGLVLVDSASPTDRAALGPVVARQEDAQFSPTDLCSHITLLDRLRRAVGYDRALAAPDPADPRLPPTWRTIKRDAQLRWLHGQSPACMEGYAEHASLDLSAAQAGEVQNLGALPLTVVTRGLDETWPSPIDIPATEHAWRLEQAALVRLSTSGQQVIARHARHDVMLDEPSAVDEAINTVLDAVRKWTPNSG